ncbi:hypothetical protein ACOXXX_21425 [Thalassococcus sp. BH17M4-6]|uniref:hypothetical protein n=1 Tax=Thalassococcus sp. BH17M4-6 TaxID=3413148 RepID=UPI003BD52477
MSKHVLKKLLQVTALCFAFSQPSAAQTPNTSSPDIVGNEIGTPPAALDVLAGTDTENGSAVAADASSLQCQKDLSAAVNQMLVMRENLEGQLMQLRSEATLCKAEIRDRASGAAELLRRAEAAEARLQELDGTQITNEERTRDAARISELEARIDSLLERLASLGISEVAEFSYLQGDPTGSLLDTGKLDALSLSGVVPPDNCPKALNWLRDRSGDDSPFRVAAWTYDEIDGWKLCRFSNLTSEPEAIAPVGSDKAHMLYFR